MSRPKTWKDVCPASFQKQEESHRETTGTGENRGRGLTAQLARDGKERRGLSSGGRAPRHEILIVDIPNGKLSKASRLFKT